MRPQFNCVDISDACTSNGQAQVHASPTSPVMRVVYIDSGMGQSVIATG